MEPMMEQVRQAPFPRMLEPKGVRQIKREKQMQTWPVKVRAGLPELSGHLERGGRRRAFKQSQVDPVFKRIDYIQLLQTRQKGAFM